MAEQYRRLHELGFADVVEGTVYTILLRLEKNGLVQVTKRPSEVGPPRKFYALNDAGREEFARFWAKWRRRIRDLFQISGSGTQCENRLGPDGFAQAITTLPDAERAGAAWRDFLDDPGPVVIGATQGASCFGAAYEFLFNMAHQLRKARLNKFTSLTFLTAEPFVGHFGIGGLPGGEKLLKMFLKKEGISVQTEVAFDEVGGDYVRLTDGSKVPFAYAMVVPPFVGQDVVRAVPELTDGKGYIPVEDTYQSRAYPEIYAAGIAAQVPAAHGRTPRRAAGRRVQVHRPQQPATAAFGGHRHRLNAASRPVIGRGLPVTSCGRPAAGRSTRRRCFRFERSRSAVTWARRTVPVPRACHSRDRWPCRSSCR